MVVHRCPWLSIAVHGCPSLSIAIHQHDHHPHHHEDNIPYSWKGREFPNLSVRVFELGTGRWRARSFIIFFHFVLVALPLSPISTISSNRFTSSKVSRWLCKGQGAQRAERNHSRRRYGEGRIRGELAVVARCIVTSSPPPPLPSHHPPSDPSQPLLPLHSPLSTDFVEKGFTKKGEQGLCGSEDVEALQSQNTGALV